MYLNTCNIYIEQNDDYTISYIISKYMSYINTTT